MEEIKLTPEQVNHNVQRLMEVVFTGNGEPSLREMMRGQNSELAQFKTEVLDRFASIESKIEAQSNNYQITITEQSKKELDAWKEKYDNLRKRHENEKTEETKNRKYWTRTVIGLLLSQVVQWGFLYFMR